MPSLTVTEARTRAASMSVSSYDVDLDLTRGDSEFASRTLIEFSSRTHEDTWVDIQPATLLSVHLNGQALDVSELHDGRLHLTHLADENVLTVDALMSYSRDGEGLHRSVDPEDKQVYLYAMAFLPAAPRIFACFDQPDLKAVFRVTVTAPTDWVVLGNGRATQVQPGHWKLAETKPLSTYFATLVAGPYHSLTAEHDGIQLGLHCRQSLAQHLDKDAAEIFSITERCFDEYHRLFGIRYAFGDYHQVFCPEYNAGAMENPGCVTFTDTLVFKARASDSLRADRAMVIAHEMAHQWFGNLVTMTWWDDLWLNESFAEYMGYRVTAEVTQFTEAWADFAYARKAWGMAADQRSSTHPIAGNGARDTEQALTDFDGISYTKGASALRQLNAYLGDEAFLAGVANHLRRHAFSNATLDDLVQSWDDASDKDVRAWAQAWLRTSGVDTLASRVTDDGTVVVERTNGSPVEVQRPHAVTAAWYGADGSSRSAPLLITEPTTPLDLPSYDGTGVILPDSRDETWAKLVLSASSLEQAPETLATLVDPLARAVLWGALRESLFDAALDPDGYLTAMEVALPHESDLGTEAVLQLATTHLGTYFPLSDQRSRVATVAGSLLDGAAPASNRQLVAARALIATTTDVAMLRGWQGSSAPQGLDADEDFRWKVLNSLCALGAAGPDEIATEQSRDPSSQGALHVLECTSAIPDARVKAQVWTDITTNVSLSNYELYAVGRFFFVPGQESLTDPYVTRFFDDMPATAALRTGWVVERLTLLTYPRYAVSALAVQRAEQCLASTQLSPGMRRSISDRTDDLRRALASRMAFPGSRAVDSTVTGPD